MGVVEAQVAAQFPGAQTLSAASPDRGTQQRRSGRCRLRCPEFQNEKQTLQWARLPVIICALGTNLMDSNIHLSGTEEVWLGGSMRGKMGREAGCQAPERAGLHPRQQEASRGLCA